MQFTEVDLDVINEFQPDEHTREQRSLAYRMPERDAQKTLKLTLVDRTVITFTRAVQRVGYETDWQSFSTEEKEERALRIVKSKTSLATGESVDIETIKRVIKALELSSPYKGVNGQVAIDLLNKTKTDGTARALWFWEPTLPRTEWFKPTAHKGEIVGRITRQTGKYAASSKSGGWDGTEPWKPPHLMGSHRQTLYVVFDHCCNRRRLIYPDDATEVKD